MTRTLALTVLSVLLIPALSLAKTHTHAPAKVQVDIPDNWKVEAEDDTLSATSADETLGLVFTILAASDVDAALDALDEELSSFITGLRPTGDAKPATVNGMRGVSVDGKGTIEGVAMDIGLMVLQAPSGKVIVILGFAAEGTMGQHERDVQSIFQSLKPVR